MFEQCIHLQITTGYPPINRMPLMHFLSTESPNHTNECFQICDLMFLQCSSSLILCMLSFAFAILPNRYHFADHFRSRTSRRNGNTEISVVTGYFDQILDHFSFNQSVTFSQRYSYTQQFTLHQRVAFLYLDILGSYEIDVISDERSPIVKTAKQFGATIFSLEHRYYGQSKPNFAKFDANNLRYLNSLQAIRDILAFIKHINVQFNMDPDVRWVLWGVGYGGNLAAEARKTNPVAVSGVISSSSALTHQLDVWQFNERVENIILEVGGITCYNKIAQGFADIRQSMKTAEGRANVSDLFNLTPRLDQTNLDNNDIQMFYSSIINPFQQIIQYNNDYNLSISDMCTAIDKSSWTNMQVVYEAYVYLSVTLNNPVLPMDISYQNYINQLADQNATGENIDSRMWQYQLCTELGWFFTTNNNEQSMFGGVLPTSLFLNQCFDIFPDANLTAISIRDMIIDYNGYYGGAKGYSGTNAVFTHGSLDPFSSVEKVSSGDFSVVVYTIPGASYASDMFPKDSTNPYINVSHTIMAENINVWVNGPRNPKTFVNTTVPWTRPNVLLDQEEGMTSKFTKVSSTIEKVPVHKFFQSRPSVFAPLPIRNSDSFPPGFEQGTFRQRHDHFDNTNPNFFQQKYYKNSEWAKTGGPNFLMIGGEGSESSSWALNQNLTYLVLAKKYGATVYVLEHRFYGDSVVGNNTQLNLLSSLQMLYDIAEFIKSVNFETGTSNPWITFGRYNAAWAREVFPDLITGAVASSAPVFVKTDFFEYLREAEQVIRAFSSSCADNIQNGFDEMRKLFLTKEGRQNLSDVFYLNPPFGDNVTDTDQSFFFVNIYTNFQFSVQYTGVNMGPLGDDYGIPDMCRFMANDSNTSLNNIAAFNQYMSSYFNGGTGTAGMNNSYSSMIAQLKNARHFGPDVEATFLWNWQSCNEFGYFQSSDSGYSIFGPTTPVSYFIQMCVDLFGNNYKRQHIDTMTENTNWKYGGRANYRGTNVVFPNGNMDPWHALGLYGLYQASDKTVVPYLIEGAGHCADMYPARDQDVPGLKVVRDLIDQNIGIWLSQASSNESTTTTTAAGTSATTAEPLHTTTKGQSTANSIAALIIILSIFVIVNRSIY